MFFYAGSSCNRAVCKLATCASLYRVFSWLLTLSIAPLAAYQCYCVHCAATTLAIWETDQQSHCCHSSLPAFLMDRSSLCVNVFPAIKSQLLSITYLQAWVSHFYNLLGGGGV